MEFKLNQKLNSRCRPGLLIFVYCENQFVKLGKENIHRTTIMIMWIKWIFHASINWPQKEGERERQEERERFFHVYISPVPPALSIRGGIVCKTKTFICVIFYKLTKKHAVKYRYIYILASIFFSVSFISVFVILDKSDV